MTHAKRALISVSNKKNLDNLVKFLHSQEFEILSTGGTAKYIKDLNIPVTQISDFTNSAEILDGRVKTLHPKIYAGILADKDNHNHHSYMENSKTPYIDIVIVNLYPFIDSPSIETIDIGGVTLLRAAAKNHSQLTVISSPNDYQKFQNIYIENKGIIPENMRREFAYKAFLHTAEYDMHIAQWLSPETKKTFFMTGCELERLRYGENPHQNVDFYEVNGQSYFKHLRQFQGKQLSYNNLLDTDAAYNAVCDFNEPTIVIVKHGNPCGVASDSIPVNAFKKALACDPLSAFGGIIASNVEVNKDVAESICEQFYEVVIAPSYTEEALAIFEKKKNLRILSLPLLTYKQNPKDIRLVLGGGLLVQDKDPKQIQDIRITPVTKRNITDTEIDDLKFGFQVCKHVRSNAIVIAKNKMAIGVGAGQMSRVDSVKIALEKAKKFHPEFLQGATLASDAFFPFADSIELAAEYGIKTIIQPGGSLRDDEVTLRANELDLGMVHTHSRHFKH